MNDRKIRKMVLAALLAALTCVATLVIQIPSPANGYVNLGDCFVLLSAWLLGPWYGCAAAGIGSMLADLLAGYAYYAPGTLVIKALMALVAALLYRKMSGRKAAAMAVSAAAAEVIMVVGYFLYAMLLLGKGIGAAASIPGNLVQGVVGMAVGMLLMGLFRKTNLDEKIINGGV
jgi:ECF transporter S component (folate family)